MLVTYGAKLFHKSEIQILLWIGGIRMASYDDTCSKNFTFKAKNTISICPNLKKTSFGFAVLRLNLFVGKMLGRGQNDLDSGQEFFPVCSRAKNFSVIRLCTLCHLQ